MKGGTCCSSPWEMLQGCLGSVTADDNSPFLESQHPPHTSSSTPSSQTFSQSKRYLKTEVAAERERYSDKHLLVVLNLMQFITSCVFLCAKSHLFSFSNRIWSRFAFGCFQLLHTLNVLVYSSLIWMLHIFYFLFLLACLPLENEFWRQSLFSCHDNFAMVYFKCYFLLYYLPFYTQTLTANVFRKKASFIEAMTSLKQQTEEKQNNSFFHYLHGFFYYCLLSSLWQAVCVYQSRLLGFNSKYPIYPSRLVGQNE